MPLCEGIGLPAELTIKVRVGRDAGRSMAKCPKCERWVVATDNGVLRWHKSDGLERKRPKRKPPGQR